MFDEVGGTIRDDDAPPSIQTISNPTVTEANTSSVNADFVIKLSSVSTKPVTIQYSTTDGSAKAPGDYTGVGTTPPATRDVPAGTDSITISVPVIGDTLFEQDEKFSVALTDPDNAGRAGQAGRSHDHRRRLDADADRQQPVGRRGQLRADRPRLRRHDPLPRRPPSPSTTAPLRIRRRLGLHRGRRRPARLQLVPGDRRSTVLKSVDQGQGRHAGRAQRVVQARAGESDHRGDRQDGDGDDHKRRRQLEALDQ